MPEPLVDPNLLCGRAGSQDRIASGSAAAEVLAFISAGARSADQSGTASRLSVPHCYKDPVITAEGRSVVLHIGIRQLLTSVEGTSGAAAPPAEADFDILI